MIRMNQQQVRNKSVKHNLFLKQEKYFSNLFTKEGFRTFLETNATTCEGMLLVASRYSVKKVWEHWLSGTDQDDYARDYFMLLKIVKVFSNNNNLWISFIEGLHQHAAIVMCLTCSTFNLEDNKLVHNSLKNEQFKLAGVPHYKESDMFPIQILNSIIKAEFDAPMLTNHIQVQVLHPKNKRFKIDPSMKILKQMSMWISTNKKLSAEPTISKQLAEDLTQIMSLSTPEQRRNFVQILLKNLGIRMMWT
jgi:hypothetical protein